MSTVFTSMNQTVVFPATDGSAGADILLSLCMTSRSHVPQPPGNISSYVIQQHNIHSGNIESNMEDEAHFLLHCTMYFVERNLLFKVINSENKNVFSDT